MKGEDGLFYHGNPNILIVKWHTLKMDLQATYEENANDSATKLLNRLSKVHHLIIDDLSDTMGDESPSMKKFMAGLTDNRYTGSLHGGGNLVTTWTSNLKLEGIASQFEEKMADRIYEMCGFGETVNEVILPNRRIQKRR